MIGACRSSNAQPTGTRSRSRRGSPDPAGRYRACRPSLACAPHGPAAGGQLPPRSADDYAAAPGSGARRRVPAHARDATHADRSDPAAGFDVAVAVRFARLTLPAGWQKEAPGRAHPMSRAPKRPCPRGSGTPGSPQRAATPDRRSMRRLPMQPWRWAVGFSSACSSLSVVLSGVFGDPSETSSTTAT